LGGCTERPQRPPKATSSAHPLALAPARPRAPHLEARALPGARLLLHRHDLHDLVLEGRPQEVLDDLVLLDGHGEQVDGLQVADLALLHQAAQLGHRDPLLLLGLPAAAAAAAAPVAAVAAAAAAAVAAVAPAAKATAEAAASLAATISHCCCGGRLIEEEQVG
jgi:hypothetical protein